MRTPHSHYKKGTHLFIILRDGTKFEDQFVDRYGKWIKLRIHGEVLMRKIRAISFRRLRSEN